MTDENIKSTLSDFNTFQPVAKLCESSRLIPLTGRSALDIHHIAAHIYAVINGTPALPFNFIKFKGDYFRQHQNPYRIVAVTEATEKMFKALDKADRYSIEPALFFPALDLSGGVGSYELVFLGIPYYEDIRATTKWVYRQQLLAKSLLDSIQEIFITCHNDQFVSVMIEPCMNEGEKSLKFEVPQKRLDAYSPLPAEKYVPPPDIAEKILKQLPRKNDVEELTAMIRNKLLYCERRDDPAWLRMVTNDVI